MTVTKVVTVVKTKKGPHTHKKKGELMENDQDAMEVSLFFLPSSMFSLWRRSHIHLRFFYNNVFFVFPKNHCINILYDLNFCTHQTTFQFYSCFLNKKYRSWFRLWSGKSFSYRLLSIRNVTLVFDSTHQRRRRWICRRLWRASRPNRERSSSRLTTGRSSTSLTAETSMWRSLSLPRWLRKVSELNTGDCDFSYN